MEYLVILGLAGWVWLQWRRIEDLSRDVRALQVQVRALAAEREPLLLTTPLPPEQEPLLLDTPLPEAANDASSGTATTTYLAWAIGAVLCGVFAWFMVAFAADDMDFALGLLASAAILGVAPMLNAGLRQRLALAPNLVLPIASVLLIWTWPASAPADHIAGPGLVTLVLLALAAFAMRRRWAQPTVFAVIVAGIVLGLAGYMRARSAPAEGEVFAWALVLAGAIAGVALLSGVNRHGRALLAASGALGAGLLVALAAFSGFASSWACATLFTGAALLAAWALNAARASGDTTSDPTIAWPAAAAAGLALLSAHALVQLPLLSVVTAALALAFAHAFDRTGWRILRPATLVAAGLAIAHALSGDFATASVLGLAPPLAAVSTLLAAAALLYAAWRTLRDDETDVGLHAEALRASVYAVLLIGVFLLTSALGFARFTTSALQALALMAAGHVIAPRQGAASGVISRWQGPVLIFAGLALSLYVCGLDLNPWWGDTPASITGPLLLDPLLVAFALPAITALIAAGRWRFRAPGFARFCLAAAVALFALWIALEIRRGAHPSAMPSGSVTLLEGLAYAVLIAGVALSLRTRVDRERLLKLVHGTYERIFGAPAAAPIITAMPTSPGTRRPRTRR